MSLNFYTIFEEYKGWNAIDHAFTHATRSLIDVKFSEGTLAIELSAHGCILGTNLNATLRIFSESTHNGEFVRNQELLSELAIAFDSLNLRIK